MTSEELLNLLEENEVTIYTPESFDYQNFFNTMDTSYHMDMKEFVSLVDDTCILRFDTDFHISGEPYCSVTYDNGPDGGTLLSEDDNGRQIGHEGNVEHFIHEFLDDGFYLREEAESKIEGFEEMIHPQDVDPAQVEAEQRLFEEMYEASLAREEEIPVTINFDPPSEEELRIYLPEEPDLSNEPFEVQQEAIADALRNGELVRAFSEMDEMTPLTPEEKFSHAGIDRTLSEETKSFFENMPNKEEFFQSIKTGFIPFELREGYTGRGAVEDEFKLPDSVITEMRYKVDPDFGMVMGVDTTKFHMQSTPDVQKNVTIIPLQYQDIDKYVHPMGRNFEVEDVKSVRAIKEFGETMEVQGEKFGVNNIVTFEVRTNDNEVHRSTVVMDDTGRVRGNLYGMAADERDGSINFGEVIYETHGFSLYSGDKEPDISTIQIEKLDRTNLDNRGHFISLEGKSENYIQNFQQQAWECIPNVLERFCDDHDMKMDSTEKFTITRRDYLEVRMNDLDKSYRSIHNITNTIGLYRDNLEAKACTYNEEARAINDEIVAMDYERMKEDVDSPKYQELSDRIDEKKEEWAKAYNQYSVTLSRLENLIDKTGEIREKESNLMQEKHLIEIEHKGYFAEYDILGQPIVKNPDEKVETRYQRICDIEYFRGTQCPENLSFDLKEIIHDNYDIIKESVDEVKGLVEEYNDSVENPAEKVQVTIADVSEQNIEKFAVYTDSGYEVLSKDNSCKNTEYISYDKELDNTDSDKKPRMEENGDANYTQALLYGREKVSGTEMTRDELKEKFLKVAVFDGHDKDKVSLRDNAVTSETVVKDLNVIRDVINENPVANVTETDEFKKEIESRMEGISTVEEAPSDNTDSDENTNDRVEQAKAVNPEDIDKKLGKALNNAYGKIDITKGVEISQGKLAILKSEAKIEANETGRKEEDIFKEKKELLEFKLEKVREDILHYKEKIDSVDHIPSKTLNSHTGYQMAKHEFDSAIWAYQELGGKLGEDAFVVKGVNQIELFQNMKDLLGSNLILTTIVDTIAGKDTVEYFKNFDSKDNGDSVIAYGGRATEFAKGVVNFTKTFLQPLAMFEYRMAQRFEPRIADIEKEIQKEYVEKEYKQEVEHVEDGNDAVEATKTTDIEQDPVEPTEDDVDVPNVDGEELPDDTQEADDVDKDTEENGDVDTKEEPNDVEDQENDNVTTDEDSPEVDDNDVDADDKDVEVKEDAIDNSEEEDSIEDEEQDKNEAIDSKDDIEQDDDKIIAAVFEREPTKEDTEETDEVEKETPDDKEPMEVSEMEEANATIEEPVEDSIESESTESLEEDSVEQSEESDLESDVEPDVEPDVEQGVEHEEGDTISTEDADDKDVALVSEEPVEETVDKGEIEGKIEECMSGNEELTEVMSQIATAIDDGDISQEDAVEAIVSGIEQGLEDGLPTESAADVVYESMCAIGEATTETYDTFVSMFEESDIPKDTATEIIHDASQMYFDADLSEMYDYDIYGQIDELTFLPDETIDTYTGEAPDYEALGQEMIVIDGELYSMDMDYMEPDFALLGQVEMIGNDMESIGFAPDIANDALETMYDTAIENNWDSFPPDVIEQIIENGTQYNQEPYQMEIPEYYDFSQDYNQDYMDQMDMMEQPLEQMEPEQMDPYIDNMQPYNQFEQNNFQDFDSGDID